jgi:hypothetical protein
MTAVCSQPLILTADSFTVAMPPQHGTHSETVPSIECGAYGKRLVVHVVDELASKTPERVWATVTKSHSDIENGFQNITFKQLANAVNYASWEISKMHGRSNNFQVIAYLGVSDVRYAIYMFAAIKAGYQV